MLAPACRCGLISVASASRSGADLLAKKRVEYRADLELFPGYGEDRPSADLDDLPWLLRAGSSSGDIGRDWRQELADGGLWEQIMAEGSRPRLNRLPASLEQRIAAIPELLEGQAFIARYALPLVPVELSTSSRTQGEMLISRAYLRSYCDELNAVVLSGTLVGELDCGLALTDPHLAVSLRRLRELLEVVGIRAAVERSLALSALLTLRVDAAWLWFVGAALADVAHAGRPLLGAIIASGGSFEPLTGRTQLRQRVRDRLLEVRAAVQRSDLPTQLQLPGTVEPKQSKTRSRPQVRSSAMADQQPLLGYDNDVFLVCGRDNRAIRALKAMLAAADVHVVGWEEARQWTGRATPYVMEVLQAAFGRVRKVLVLFTPDDEVQLFADFVAERDPEYEKRRGFQARPNVLVEAGMAFALQPDRYRNRGDRRSTAYHRPRRSARRAFHGYRREPRQPHPAARHNASQRRLPVHHRL